jgi:hypothetical protein
LSPAVACFRPLLRSRLLLLVDGVRANDNIYDSVLVGREFPMKESLRALRAL